MVVGPTGRNADRVTAALEQARVKVVRVGSAPVACEKLAAAMPQVVILVAPQIAPLRAALADRAEAVGAIVIDVDDALEGDAYEDAVNEIITTAITRKMERDEVEPTTILVGESEPPTMVGKQDAGGLDDSAVVDDGWDD